MDNVVTNELIRRAIIMALANIEMEEDFCLDKDKDVFDESQAIEEKVKKKVLNDERHLG